ncbi:serine/threonine-protein kinase Nek4-like isoform X4 [Procambarus clarkii]|uniref:serine/threonine-protein kinase Nek4-like isoform X3 n=1 Tax=Procambarus clarkii TaxID=6728 RepID=UPI001E674A0D|nr:serine/threonine-protein kinase Nek4-like isoform X2 [Procambarus clarkii]
MEGVREVKRLGKGTYGEVFLVEKNSKQYVLKKDYLKVGQEIHLLMEYCDGGDLHSRIQKQKVTGVPFSEHQIRDWTYKITSALQYLHQRHVLHRDLKPMNIFLTKAGGLKLGDFGLARVISPEADLATTCTGTRAFMAPEIYSMKPYDTKADMWSLGCCIFEIASFRFAFPFNNVRVPACYSQDLQQLVSVLLNPEPEERPSALQVLSHPFLQALHPNNLQHSACGNHDDTQHDHLLTDEEIRVIIIDLHNNKSHLKISSSKTVLELKRLLGETSGVDVDTISIVFNTVTLSDKATLSSYGVRYGSTLQVFQRFLGGARSLLGFKCSVV